jgi:hypothetical protein
MFRMRKGTNWAARRGCATIASCAVVLLLLGQPTVKAVTNIVNTLSASQLRVAVESGGTVLLQVNGTITLNNTLAPGPSTVIDATGYTVTVSGNNALRLLKVPTNTTCFITNVIFTSGANTGSNGVVGTTGSSGSTGNPGGNGANGTNGIGGAILNLGSLVLANCQILSSTATGGAGGAGGGGGNGSSGLGGNGGNGGNGGSGLGAGIFNGGNLLLTNCTVANNTAVGGSGGVGGTNGASLAYPGSGGVGAIAAGAGLYSTGTVTIVNCTFNNNSVQAGGSQAVGGKPNGAGDGNPGPSGPVGQGGGICNLGTNVIINSTFFQNDATGGAGGDGSQSGQGPYGGNGGNGGNGYGGGVYNAGFIGVTNCTFSSGMVNGGTNGVGGAGAHTGSPGSMGAGYGGNIFNASGTFNLQASILAYVQNGGNAYGTVSDRGFNLSSDGTPVLSGSLHSTNNLDPNLDTVLETNGGPTLTLALLYPSPAMGNGGTPALPFDQRLDPRPTANADIGAFQYENSPVTYSISGKVAIIGTNSLSGLVVTATGLVSTSTDADGNFAFSNVASNTYTIAVQPSALFQPGSSNVTVGPANPSASVNFAATAQGSRAIMGTNTLTITNHQLVLSFSTALSNRTYRIQASTNLSSSTNWHDISTNFNSTGSISYTNSFTNFPAEFFRAVTP